MKIWICPILKNVSVLSNNWLNLHGLNEIEIIESIGVFFKIDNFLLSDILNTSRRTKLEEFSDTLFFLHQVDATYCSDNISVEQISFLIKGCFDLFSGKEEVIFYSYQRTNP
jgi:magnesium transporter